MADKKSLGKILLECREFQGFTLRQVEEATGISNAYLSQLENDKIRRPSVNTIYKLSKLYGSSVETMLYASGIITDEPSKINSALCLINPKGLKLTTEEERALIEYLGYLRYKKRRGL